MDLDAVAGLSAADAGTVRIGMLGTMARWKGHKVFLRALAKLPRTLDTRAYIIGGALYRTQGSQYELAELRALAADLELSGRVGFTGFVSDPAAAMRALDIVVHASTAPEPFGLVIAEAMACERPVVTSEHAGALELIDPALRPLLHASGDAAALAARLLELCRDPERRRAMAAAGRAAALKHFDRNRLAEGVIPVYDRITGKAQRRVPLGYY